MKSSSLLFFAIILTAVIANTAQTSSPSKLDEILATAETRSREYVETFRDLLATETKTFTTYKKNGEEKNTRSVNSLFVVMPLTKEPDRVIEFRNVTAVDGKTVSDGDKRAGELFAKLSNADTAQNEIKRLDNEALRYDGDIQISGLTLFQSIVLRPSLRSAFSFTISGSELINGQPVIVVDYLQLVETPMLTTVVSGSEAPSGTEAEFEIAADKNVTLNGRLSGRLYLDEGTFRLRKEIRRLTIQPEGFSERGLALEEIFSYQDSSFGILTPRSIIHTQYRVKLKYRKLLKDVLVRFEYSQFSKPDVEVKADEVKPKS
ncbi:MAG: hypothetical protein IPJ55_13605 [Chloracidobacterium sp.]|nr:hypothetical protein [Chloracidobacterium sp.]